MGFSGWVNNRRIHSGNSHTPFVVVASTQTPRSRRRWARSVRPAMSYHTQLPVLPEQGVDTNHHHPQQRIHSPIHHRPRPVSMPPQAYSLPSEPPDDHPRPVPATPAPAATSAQHQHSVKRREREASSSSQQQQQRSRSSRMLGDYTLSKTLGAGSMGKVKLATHNVTGEKVCYFFFSAKFYPLTPPPQSSQSRFSLVCIPSLHPPTASSQNQRQSKPPRTPPRRSAPSERPLSP